MPAMMIVMMWRVTSARPKLDSQERFSDAFHQ
jgi:hypothetical protein